MKGLKKIALVTAIAGASFGAQAELKAMNDAAMGDVTGQAGVTIELDANVNIGEIQYKDQGSLFITNVQIGGAGLNGYKYKDGSAAGTALDNLKIDIDIAGDGSDLGQAYGLAKINDPDVTEVANVGDHGEVAPTIEDGDLVIALDAIDQNDGVDLALNVGAVSLGTSSAASGSTVGQAAFGSAPSVAGTVLVSNLRMNGQIGPIDIVIDGQTNNMNINAYFQVGGQLNMPFMATQLGFKLHNARGEDQLIYTNSRGDVASFAHAQVDISPNADPAKGLNVNVTDFSGDLDLTDITLGSAPAIGSVYMTDLDVRANMNIYGH